MKLHEIEYIIKGIDTRLGFVAYTENIEEAFEQLINMLEIVNKEDIKNLEYIKITKINKEEI